MTQANHDSEFKWLGLEPNDHRPSEIGTCSVFEPPLYLATEMILIIIVNIRMNYTCYTVNGTTTVYKCVYFLLS